MDQAVLMIRRLTQYHRWANQRLSGPIRDLDETDYRRDLKLFFGSIHGTLNHLYLVDRLWFARLTGESYQPSGLDEEVEPDRDQLLERIDQQSRQWVAFAKGVSGDSLSGTLSYRDTQGRKRSVNRAGALQNVFNHGTHHRGQVSAGLTGLGREAPEIDLVYYLLEGT